MAPTTSTREEGGGKDESSKLLTAREGDNYVGATFGLPVTKGANGQSARRFQLARARGDEQTVTGRPTRSDENGRPAWPEERRA
jgi:hypothetical protein